MKSVNSGGAEMNAIEMQDVTKVHGNEELAVTALAGASLTIDHGEMVAIMGASGSGKSTLLNLAGCLDRPSSGEVRVEGVNASGLDSAALAQIRRQRIGVVFQDLNLISSLTAVENVSLPLELDGLKANQAKALAMDALKLVGIEALQDRFPDLMSGGQQQRVAIARSLVGGRRIILADEPTGALDSETSDDVIALLRRLTDDGIACMLVTHEARLAAWADRIVFLRDGRIVDEAAETQPYAGQVGR